MDAGNPLKMANNYVVWIFGGCKVKLMNPLIIKGKAENHTECKKRTLCQRDRRTHNIRVRS